VDRSGSQDEKDYERLCESNEAFVYVATTHLMASCLARARGFPEKLLGS
jgi:hypothetical protein